MNGVFGRLADWLDDRTGWRTLKATLLDRHIPRGVGWAYTLGSASLTAFLVQAVTGILLAMHYSPSPDHAYDSVKFVTESVPLGGFLRGLHKWGATAMVVLVILHALRVFVMGAYKKPREATWLVGVGLLLVTVGFGFTGYLLPWDQKAYWATAVGANIADQTPVVGPYLAKILRGGDGLGATTLSRFYAIHVLVLPALLLLAVGAHLFLVVWHGISPPPRRSQDPPDEPTEKAAGKSFFPYIVAKDAVAAVLVVAVVAALGWFVGAELEDLADPTDTTYNPRPEWYFLWMFLFLKLFPGSLEPVAAVVAPGLLLGALAFLPFLDRRAQRHPFHRPVVIGLGGLGLAGIVYLGVQGWRSPLVNPEVEKDPAALAGRRLYEDFRCSHCHSINGRGGTLAPALTTVGSERSETWLTQHFRDPKSLSPGSPMPKLGLMDEEIRLLVAYLKSLSGAGTYSPNAPRIFADNCSACHRLRGEGNAIGPDLTSVGNYRDAAWLKRYITDPTAVDPKSGMPPFSGVLGENDLLDVARYLAAQKGR